MRRRRKSPSSLAGQGPIPVNAPSTNTHASGRPERKHVVPAVPAFQRIVVQSFPATAGLHPLKVLDCLEVSLLATKRAGDPIGRQLVSMKPRPLS